MKLKKSIKSKPRQLNYSALKILRTFDKIEIKEFVDFIKLTPFLNTIGGHFTYGKSKKRKKLSPKLIFFLKLIKNYKLKISGDLTDLTNEYLMEKLKTKSTSIIKKHFSELEKLCEHFLVFKEISEDKRYYPEALLYQLLNRNLESRFDKKFNELTKTLNKSNDFHLDDFYTQYQINSIRFMMKWNKINKKGDKIEDLLNMSAKPNYYLLFHFVFDSLKVIVGIKSQTNSHEFNPNSIEYYKLFKDLFPDKTLEDIVKLTISKAPNNKLKKIIKLYWTSYQLRITEGEEVAKYLRQYFALLKSLKNVLSIDEKYDLYHDKIEGFWLALKFPKYIPLEFKIYNQYLLDDGYKATGKDSFTYVEFMNLLYRGLATKKFIWTKQYIKKYLRKVPKEYHDIIRHYTMACVYESKKDYKAALQELDQIKKRPHYTVTRDISQRRIRIYYEMGKFDESLDVLDSLTHYLKNQKIGETTNLPYEKFIWCTKKLIQIQEHKKINYSKVLEVITKSKSINSREWLKEKFEILQKQS